MKISPLRPTASELQIAPNSIAITAPMVGDATLTQIGIQLRDVYTNLGYPLYGVLEDDIEKAKLFNYIVLNRLGVQRGHDKALMSKCGRILATIKSTRDPIMTYFIDDFVMHLNKIPIQFMQNVDRVVTSNHILKKYIEEEIGIPDVKIVPTHMNYDWIDTLPEQECTPKEDNDKFKIVWGSLGNLGLGFMQKLFKRIKKIKEFKDVIFLIYSMNPAIVRRELVKERGVNFISNATASPERFFGLLKKCDMLINPVDLDYVHIGRTKEEKQMVVDCKNEVKFTMAGSLRKPLLSCPMRAYNEIYKSDDEFFISGKIDEWIDIILYLKENPEVCRYIGQCARERVEEDYNYINVAERYIDVWTTRDMEEEDDE